MGGRIRLLILFGTFAVVGIVGYILSLYANGYRFDIDEFAFLPNGLFVIKSNPDGAQVFINGELKTATNATIDLPPGIYDVAVKKEGYGEWNKRLTITKEIVTEADAHLFKNAPSLSAVTFSGVTGPITSPDFTKIAYLTATEDEDLSGIWIMETINLPLGFSREPRKITDGIFTNAKLTWSLDSREILLESDEGSFILDSGSFTEPSKLLNIQNQVDIIFNEWAMDEQTRNEARLTSLPVEIADILANKTSAFIFSPDDSKVLYTANGSATIPDLIIDPPLPGASTQRQEREISGGRTYIYDFKEDRNFLIDEDESTLSIKTWQPSDKSRRMFWFATSRHVVLAEEGKISIMDLDSTNKREVYSGAYESPYVLSAPSTDRLLILTNLGATESLPNLYSLSLK